MSKYHPEYLFNLDPLDARRGSLKIGQLGGVPIFLHWTLLLGIGPITLATGFDLAASVYYFLAILALIIVHELGHVAAAVKLKLPVYGFHLTFLGGHCVIGQNTRVRDSAIVYGAGVAAQAVLLLLTYLCVLDSGAPVTPFGNAVVHTFTVVNVCLMLFNLLPFTLSKGPASDGQVLLRLYQHARHGKPHPFAVKPLASTLLPPETSLLAEPALRPPGFTTGIELMNDDTTPMLFVVDVLCRHLSLDHERAVEAMLRVHGKGGMLFAIDGLEQSQAIAAAITREARDAGHQLVCRAVDAR